MAININTFIQAIGSTGRKYSTLEQLVLDYGILTKKLDNPEKQSWYGKKANDNNEQKLKDLNAEFEKIRADFNTDLDTLLEEKNRLTEIKDQESSKKIRNTISQIAIAAVTPQINYLQEIIALKARFSKLQNLDYYFEHESELMKLLNWE